MPDQKPGKQKDKQGIRVYPPNVPDDVLKILLDEKSSHEMLIKKSFSMQATIYKIIREFRNNKLKVTA